MPRKEDRRIQKTRKAMMTALEELVREKQSAQITVKELTERANITRKTFYLHYSTMKELFDSLIEKRFEEILNEAEARFLEDGSFDFYGFFEYLSHMDDLIDPFYRILMEGRDILPTINRVLHNRTDSVRERFQHLIPDQKEIMYYYAHFFCTGIYSMLFQWSCRGRDIPLQELAGISETMYRSTIDAIMDYAKEKNKG